MSKQFDMPEVLAALEAAVEKRGANYTYRSASHGFDMPACLYTHKAEDGGLVPGCIVGQVYFDLTGEPVPFTGKDQNGMVEENEHTSRTFTAPALRVLSAAQMLQDDGGTWGEALAEAKKRAAEGVV